MGRGGADFSTGLGGGGGMLDEGCLDSVINHVQPAPGP